MIGTVQLAAIAVDLLRPYLGEFAGGLVKTATEGAGNAARELAQTLYRNVTEAFGGDAEGEAALTGLAHDPDDEAKASALAQKVRQALEADDGFRASTEKIAEQSGRAPSFTTTVHGNVEKVVNIGTIGGDAHF